MTTHGLIIPQTRQLTCGHPALFISARMTEESAGFKPLPCSFCALERARTALQLIAIHAQNQCTCTDYEHCLAAISVLVDKEVEARKESPFR